MTSDELRHEIADLKIRLALQMEFEDEVALVHKEIAQPSSKPVNAAQEDESRILKDIESSLEQNRQRFSGKAASVPKSRRVAVIIAAILMIVATSAFATVQMIRVGILKLEIKPYKNRTEFYLMQTEYTMDIPDGWTGVFYPAYIPDSFTFSYLDVGEVVYLNENGYYLRFLEEVYGSTMTIDTENALVEKIRLHDTEATLIEKYGRVSVIWSEHNRMFAVHLYGDRETATEVANSVTLIR